MVITKEGIMMESLNEVARTKCFNNWSEMRKALGYGQGDLIELCVRTALNKFDSGQRVLG